jgi:hypothetical protein
MSVSHPKYCVFTFFFQDEEDGKVVATESILVECPGPQSDQSDMMAAKLAAEVAVKFERRRRRENGIEGDFSITADRPTVNFKDPGFGAESADAQVGMQYAWRVHPGDTTKRRA